MCDLDGTLLTAENTVSERTKQAIKKARKAGIYFGIATGRPTFAVQECIKLWGIEEDVDCIVGFNGAMTQDFTLNKCQLNYPLTPAMQQEIINSFNTLDVNFMIYEPDGIYTQKVDAVSTRLSRNNHLPRFVLTDEILTHEHAKMLVTCPQEQMDQVMNILNNLHLDTIRGVRSQPDLFEIFDARNSKSRGIEQVANYHGFKLDQVMAFGDEDNDLEMLEECGIGVAMANASSKALAIADEVTASNLEDGVAQRIEQYLK